MTMSKSETTLVILEEALERLLSGTPINTRPGARLSINCLAKEAGLGSGSIYYEEYAEFREKAKKAFAEHKPGGSQPTGRRGTLSEQTLRADRDNEKRLKEEYRAERDEARQEKALMASQLVRTEHELYELQLKLAELTHLFEQQVGVHPDKLWESAEVVTFPPRNLQEIK